MDEAEMDALFAGAHYDIQQFNHFEKASKLAFAEMQSHLIDKFEAHVAKQPKKSFLIYDGLIYSYETIDTLACKVACVAKSWDVQSNECVAIMIENEPSFIYTFLGLQKLGIPVAFINTRQTGQSLVHSLKAAECKALIVGSGKELLDVVTEVLPQLEKLPVYVQDAQQKSLPEGIESFDDLMKDASLGAPSPSLRSGVKLTDTCCYIYTSGTTGLPKPVFIPHLKAAAVCCVIPSIIEVKQEDVLYIVIPLYHSTAFMVGFSAAMASGCSIVLRKKFSASEFWDDCRKYNVTIFPYVGELLRYLLSQPKSELDGVHKLRGIFGNGLRKDIWEEVVARFKIPFVGEIYSSTEGMSGTVNFFQKPGAVGRLSPFYTRLDPDKRSLVKYDAATTQPIRDANGRCIRVQIGEPGLMISKVPDHSRSARIYKADCEATEKKFVRDVFAPGDCYMNYGDALVLDKEYFLYFYDRLGDTFRWKGTNVSTTEVANVITSLPFVDDANVYGVTIPDRDGKAGMVAINVNPKAQFGNKELRELYALVGKELPKYAWPLFVRHIPEAALTGTFKNRKVDLAQEGYDLSKVNDPLYFIDNENQTYSPLDKSNLSTFLSSRL